MIAMTQIRFLLSYFSNVIFQHNPSTYQIHHPTNQNSSKQPHFKRKNHGRRIISQRLLSEYAYLLQPGIGKLYCITDVKELHDWHIEQCNNHPLFKPILISSITSSEEEKDNKTYDDPCVKAMIYETEEGKKVSRSGGTKYYAVYECLPKENIRTRLHAGNFFSQQSITEEK